MSLNFDFMIKTFWACFKAIPVTLEITFLSLIFAVLPAYGIARSRLKNRKVGKTLSAIYVSFFRGTPMILQILIVYSLFPSLLNSFFKSIHSSVNIFNLNPIVYALIVFTLNTIAILSEVFRSAIMTVEKTQYESALCLGLTKFQVYKNVIIPQSIVSAIPNICNLTVNLIKNSSLAFLMTVKDITAVAKIEASYGFNYIEAYLDILVIYVIVCSVIQWIYKALERRFTFVKA